MGGKGQFMLGAIIIGLGVLMLLNNLGVTEISVGYVISNFWPLFLVVWGVQFFYSRKGTGEIITGIILVAVGGILLGQKHGFLNVDLAFFWKIFWPAFFIILGISFIRGPKPMGKTNWALMGGLEKTKEQWKLEDGTYWAVMGGIELDLRRATMENKEYYISCNAVMGGIELTIPNDVTVICEGTAILGGIELLGEGTGGLVSTMKVEQAGSGVADAKPVIYIHCRAIMGGIEVVSRG